jgi:hypothetical protein
VYPQNLLSTIDGPVAFLLLTYVRLLIRMARSRTRFLSLLGFGVLSMLLLLYLSSGGQEYEVRFEGETPRSLTSVTLDSSSRPAVVPSRAPIGSPLASAEFTSAVGKNRDSGSGAEQDRVRGVVLFLAGGRWDTYFERHALPRLENYFLSCFPYYPVHIFHEHLSPTDQQRVSALIPSASAVSFENVSRFWAKLPAKISEQQLIKWMNEGVQKKFQGRGYRLMCRFWAALVWTLPSLDQYDYYWRLDTDSVLVGPLLADPFVLMRDNGCEYGFNRLTGENPHVLTELWETYNKWLDAAPHFADANNRSALRRFAENFFLDPKTKIYGGRMFYNNFEMGRVQLKRHAILHDMFQYMDTQPPYGFLRYRWGDAPWHTLAVQTILQGRGFCNITKRLVPYRHAMKKPEPLPPQSPSAIEQAPKCTVHLEKANVRIDLLA